VRSLPCTVVGGIQGVQTAVMEPHADLVGKRVRIIEYTLVVHVGQGRRTRHGHEQHTFMVAAQMHRVQFSRATAQFSKISLESGPRSI